MNRTWEVEPTPLVLGERIRREASRQMGTGRRLNVASLNEHLICALCSGYIIEAMSIAECWHTFCRSCITKYLQANKNKDFCPRCDVKIQTLKPDKMLQDLIYKLVPGLYQNEMKRRRDFYGKKSPEEIDAEGEERGILPHGARFFSQDDSISLSLEYYNGEDFGDENNGDEKLISNGKPKRYLQCPAAVTVRHLKKFLRMKYGIGTDYRVDIIYNDECLAEEFSLIDVAYTFAWRRKSPMRFSYRIFTRNPVKTVAPQKSFKTASTVQNNRRNNPKNQSSLEQQRQSEYLGNFNLNPTNTGFFKNQNRSSQSLSETTKNQKDPYYQGFREDSQEKLFPSSEDSNASGLRIISEKENSEESQEFEEKNKKISPVFDEEAEDGFGLKKIIFKNKHKSEGKKDKKKHDDVYPEKRRKSAGDEIKKKSLKRRKSMIENFSEDFESDEKSKEEEESESTGKNKSEALRKVFICKDKPEKKDEEVRRKKRKKSKHHEGETKKRKLESEPTSPTILSFAKDPLKLKVKLTPIKPIPVEPEKVEEKTEEPKETEKESKAKANGEDKKPTTDKERLLHLRAVRHKKDAVNKKDYINAPPSLTISKVDSSEQQPVKSTLVESRPSLEISLVKSSEKNRTKPEKDPGSPEKSEAMDTFGVLDLSEKSTRTKEHSSPSPKEITDLVERNKKSTQQSILQIAQTLVNRRLSPENHLQSVADHSAATALAMRNLMTLSDTAVNILKAAQSQNYSPESPKRFPSPSSKSIASPISTKSLKDCENGSSLKIPYYPLIPRERPNPIPPIPNLHEIPRGRGRPVSSLNRPMIPTGQNQTVRQIPNPSVVSSRQNNQFNLLRPSLPVLKPPPKSPPPKTENGEIPGKPNKLNLIPPLQSIKTKLPVPKTDEEPKEKTSSDNNNPTVPKTMNNNNNNNTSNNNNIAKTVQNGSDKALIPLKNGDDNNKKINNIKINNANSIRRIESMTRNIESVAAGLTARAVSNAMIDAK